MTVARVMTVLSALVALLMESGSLKSMSLSLTELFLGLIRLQVTGGYRSTGGYRRLQEVTGAFFLAAVALPVLLADRFTHKNSNLLIRCRM